MKWTPTDRPFPLTKYVEQAWTRLRDSGFEAYIVGGSVRDFLLGREAKDHDLATDANPDEIHTLFPESVTVGKAFGVLKLPTRDDLGNPVILEIATFRRDLDYRDHRHPEGIEIAGPEEDARRRDFTINALFYDPARRSILDTVGGMDDLRDRRLRAIGDPDVRFREDALRLLRALRFSTTLGFTIESGTEQAIRRNADLIRAISPERVHEELKTAFSKPDGAARMLASLAETGLLEQILPELSALKRDDPDAWAQLLAAARGLPHGAAASVYPRMDFLVWALLFTNLTPSETRVVESRLRFSKSEIETLHGWLDDLKRIARAPHATSEAEVQRLIRKLDFAVVLDLYRATAPASAEAEFCAEKLERYRSLPSDDPTRAKWLSGQDLLTAGIPAGPGIGELLAKVEDLTLEGKIRSREEALRYALTRSNRL